MQPPPPVLHMLELVYRALLLLAVTRSKTRGIGSPNKGTVADQYDKFTQLLHRLQQLKICHPLDVIASECLRFLKQDIFVNKNWDLPTLEELHRQAVAVEAEYQLKPAPVQQQLRGIFPNNPQRKGNCKSNNNGNNSNKNRDKPAQGNKWCDLHRWNPLRTSADCRGTKRMKVKGTCTDPNQAPAPEPAPAQE